LVAACDLAVATADAQFRFYEVRLGIIAATISPYVVAAVGPRQARALFATGTVFDAAYGEKVGLVSEVVADAAGLAEARDRISAEMMACGPEAVAESKRLVEDVAYRPIDEVMEETARRIARIRVGEEGQEGVRAFLEKRKPSWLA
jgi:methylglutaconyl-CoA hydratase